MEQEGFSFLICSSNAKKGTPSEGEQHSVGVNEIVD